MIFQGGYFNSCFNYSFGVITILFLQTVFLSNHITLLLGLFDYGKTHNNDDYFGLDTGEISQFPICKSLQHLSTHSDLFFRAERLCMQSLYTREPSIEAGVHGTFQWSLSPL